MLNLGTLIAGWLNDSRHRDSWIIGDQDHMLSMIQLQTPGTVDLKDIPHYIINAVEGTVKQCCVPPAKGKGTTLRAEDPEFFAKFEQVLSDAATAYHES